ncbi:carboxyl transferase domain-containing protein [Jiangella mangrovi]|uniref:Acetyl-CoA carboxylase carboxyl transferase subunit beta n=1 Tax=Jiangella mangrovi TaxID=1524084 RepID=A0A7W9GS17_9ACTN|nr:carboxyl transferase domain-containing protein [Jiangella mangrovi]MBB5788988.1 acetyl-CoA carboxylase carboxyl transferase subunit beta [Jiangella mangrovi]
MIKSGDLIERVLDGGSWRPWDAEAPPESVVTGQGAIGGRAVAVVASEFGYLAGSIGLTASARVVAAVERATAERLPLLASPASGGTRLQEGTRAFVKMAGIASALAVHRSAGLPYLVYLRHPTTGGVLASWGSLGHVTAAEPGALVGLLGPRVQRAIYGRELPAGVQRAENLHAHGLIDAVLPPDDLREVAIRVLSVLSGEVAEELTLPTPVPAEPALAPTGTWDSVVRSRRSGRPGVRALLKLAASDVTLLSGTGAGEHDDALVLALARFGRAPCVVLGQDRRGHAADVVLGPAGLREAMRGMRIAAELGLPLVTVVDTPGAPPTRQAEEGGLAGGIALCLADLVALRSPTVCVLLGQGGGGTALALLPADRVLVAQHGWLAPLPPEGAAEILHGSPSRAAVVADEQAIGAAALVRDGIADRVVPEHPDAADEPAAFVRRVGAALEQELLALLAADVSARLAARSSRYR